ncbi:MAG: sugar transferase [Pseudomonadota bacterium]|nr:sugar transferase [Pseudomonadota bacterium]
MKRFTDIVASFVVLVMLAPVLIALGLAVALTSPGGAFYRQVRVGRGTRPFRMLKFRSMVADADRIGGWSTAEGDPRITPVGRFIRRTSLDELPQLLNVLKGDMSLIGPRPDVPAQREGYTAAEWEERHRVRPGITGLAQALARNAATPAERTALDLRYVREQSLWLDMKIVVWTLRQVLGRGSF